MTKNSLSEINEILSGYCDDIQSLLQKESERIAKDGAKTLRATSPINKKNTPSRGKYAKGWKVKKEHSRGVARCTIYNSAKPSLTHLLERGHDNRDGSKTPAIVHIKPVEEQCKNEYLKYVESGIRRAKQ